MSQYSPAKVIKELLIDQGLGADPSGSSPTWPVYVNFMPDDDNVPNNAIAVFDQAGQNDGRSMDTGITFWHRGIQILVRAVDDPTCYEKAEEIEDALALLENTTVEITSGTSFTVGYLSQQSPALWIGHDPEDARRRILRSINYLITLKED